MSANLTRHSRAGGIQIVARTLDPCLREDKPNTRDIRKIKGFDDLGGSAPPLALISDHQVKGVGSLWPS
ncbi:MAG: hypothetical protein RBR43_05725 [Desulfuromonadaceae bacterium]|nr:hypothetical protein [Desulfuromonas sp.]MDY0185360.1 hypothetical protein [Desulfuromonadaceae bacterium]